VPWLSTAFHPPIDGQTARTTVIMEPYLRAYINYLQDDWMKFLPMAEFAANNQVSDTTTVSPYFTKYRFVPDIYFELGICVVYPEEL
jgi:hypothetical protein